MYFNIEINNLGRFFNIPCTVADNYLKDTDGDYIKVLVFILSMGNSTLSDDIISEKTGISQSKIKEAVNFWVNKEIIRVTGEEFIGFDIEKAHESKNTGSKEFEDNISRTRSENVAYTPSEIAELVNNSPELKMLFDNVQLILGKLINYTEQKGFIYIYEYYGFDAPSILLLTEYCMGLGKTNIAYIKTVARSFFERDIVTYKDIEKEIIRLNEKKQYENKIAAAFGISTRLTPTQLKYIHSWDNSGISVELASYAYEKCVDSTGKMVMKYIDTVLDNWKKAGINTVEQAKKELKPKEKKSGDSHSYDLNEIDEFQKNFLLKRKNKG